MQRVREIAQVAARHGFGYAFERWPRRRSDMEHESLESQGRHLREMLDELGPTFVKFGQLLSTRPDLVPPEIAAELRQLQDAVSPLPWEDVERVIQEQLHGDVGTLFASFEREPVAAASIGQVHLAELVTGRRVAVKVQRPTAPQQIDSDIVLLRQVAKIVKSRVPSLDFVDPTELVDEFARSIRQELDYRIEARNAETFRKAFSDTPEIVIPKVYWTYSTERVLTLEQLDGAQLADVDFDSLEPARRKGLATLLARCWMEMIFRHGVYHADPHPANIFVMPDDKLGLVDFGIVGSLTQQDMRKLTRLLMDAVNENVDALPKRLHELGVRFNRDQEDELRFELQEIYYRYHGASLGEIDPLQVIREAFNLVARMHLRLPTRYALLDKTLATLGNVGVEVYPDFNVFEVAEPYAAELMARQFAPGALAERGKEELLGYGGVMLELPFQVHDMLEQFRDGEIDVRVHLRGLEVLMGKSDVLFNRLVIAIVMVGTLIGAALIGVGVHGGPYLFGVQLLVWIGIGISGFLGFILVVSIIRSGRL